MDIKMPFEVMIADVKEKSAWGGMQHMLVASKLGVTGQERDLDIMVKSSMKMSGPTHSSCKTDTFCVEDL